MKERLYLSVEPGTVERLRELAGGERKVGELVSTFADWLWQQRDVLERTSLEKCELLEPDANKRLNEVQRRLAGIEEVLDNLGWRIDVVDDIGIH